MLAVQLLLVVIVGLSVVESSPGPVTSLLRSSWNYTPFLLEGRLVGKFMTHLCWHSCVVNFYGNMTRTYSGNLWICPRLCTMILAQTKVSTLLVDVDLQPTVFSSSGLWVCRKDSWKFATIICVQHVCLLSRITSIFTHCSNVPSSKLWTPWFEGQV